MKESCFMKKKVNKLISFCLIISVIAAEVFYPFSVSAQEDADANTIPQIDQTEISVSDISENSVNDGYACDFTGLVVNGSDTVYGGTDDIFDLNEYTTAYLNYEGTYVSSDGTLYLMGGNNGKGHYDKGAYIEFTAPYDGVVTYSGSYLNYYIDGVYTGYNSDSAKLKAGQKLQIGQRVNDRSYISSISFTPSEQPTDVPTAEPTGEGYYESPSTAWDFSTEPLSGKNTPSLAGNAQWQDGEIIFPSDTTASGSLTLDMSEPIKNNISVEFDITGHIKALGGQFINFRLSNSEEVVAELQVHPYSDNDDTYNAKGLYICGTQAVSGNDIRAAWNAAATTHVKIDIDYKSRTADISIGENIFTAELPEGTVTDADVITFEVTRSKTESSRYISLDNLIVSEFESQEPDAPVTVTDGYDEETVSGYPCRVKINNGKPAVIYLASELRYGTGNYSQLYDAKYIFDILGSDATLIAPQTETGFTDVSALVNETREKYNAPSVAVIGQSKSSEAALSSRADRIVTIAGSGETLSSADVWSFAGYNDNVTPVSDVRSMVNRLQLAGTNTRYTEYPFDGHKINEKAALESGFANWLINGSEDSRIVDLVLFSGQSNMAGRGDYAEALPCPAGKGYEYHAVTEPGTLSTVSEPFGKYENNDAINDNSGAGEDRRSGDMVSALMSAYYDETGIPMVGVQASRGGQPTDFFLGAMDEMQSRFNEAEEYLENAGYTIRKKLLVWCQGESDADRNRSDEAYKTNTLKIFSELGSGCGISDIFIIRTGHYNINYGLTEDEEPSADALAKDAEYLRISEAQQALADENDNIYIAASLYSDDYLSQMRDQYHYYQSVYNSVGTAAGKTIADVYADEPVPTPEPIEGVYEITSSDKSIDVSSLKNYGTNSYRMYHQDGSYETVTAENGTVANTTNSNVTVTPEYRFEFTDLQNTADENISGYVKVGEGSYSKEQGYGLVSADYSINSNGCKADTNPIKVDLPEGFYDITVYRLGGGRADIYSNGRLIANNTTSASSQNRGGASALMEIPGIKHDGGSIDITFGNTSGNRERIASVKIARVPEEYRKPVIWIAGDSESSNYYPFDIDGDDLESDRIMITGFGQQLSKLLSDKYSVSNYGQPSATVKTWYDECFDSVNELMQPGDTILVDFGINDSVSISNKLTTDEMKAQMKQIFDAAKAKNVTPVLISPVYNGKYQHRTYFTYDAESNSNEMYAFAQENDIACIDLNKYTQLYVNKAIEITGDESWSINNYHVSDNLHLTQQSALLAASFIAAGMEKIGYETSDFEFIYEDISEVLSDNMRGNKTGEKRLYSVAAAKAFMDNGTVLTPSTPTPTTEPETDDTKITYDGAEITMTSNDNGLKNAVLAAAEYNDGVLSSIRLFDVEFINGMAKQAISVPAGTVFYLWDGTDTMRPLAESYEYTSSPTPTAAPTSEPISKPTNEPLFELNFENSDLSGWKQSNGGVNSIMTDSDPKIGKYMNQQGGGGGSRAVEYRLSNPVTEDFVFEADIKAASTSEFSANISLLSSDTTVNSTGTNNVPVDGLIFKADVNTNETRFLINNEQSSKGSTLDSITGKKILSYEFPEGSWVHIRAICCFEDQTARIQLTSLNGETVYFDGKADMYSGSVDRITDLQRIYIVAPRPNQNFGVDNIVIRKANGSELAEAADFHKVTIKNRGESYDYYIQNGKPVYDLYIPDTSVYGNAFEGWNVNGTVYSTEQLKSLPITSDSLITAVISESYIEKVASVEFASFPTDNRLVMSTDANGTEFYGNKISLKITGEAGTDLAAFPDERAEPKIDWTFTGFYTKNGEPTTDDRTTVFPGTKQFCDSYGKVTISNEYQPEISFELKNTSENYYGKVTAVVTYGGNSFTVEKPLVIIGNNSQSAGTVFPKAGFVSDYNMFEDGMEGDYTADCTLLGGWSIIGSNTTNKISVERDTDGKFLKISKNEKKDSSYFYNEISTTQDQLIFSQNIRFNTPLASIYYKGEAPNSFSKNQSAFTVLFNSGTLTINGVKAADNLDEGKWYRLIISSAVSSQKCWARVYSQDGELISESQTTNFENDSVASPNIYAYRLSDRSNASSSVDINDLNIIKAEADLDQSVIKCDNPEMIIPDDDTVSQTTISLEAVTAEGYEMIGNAVWSIADDSTDGVSVTANDDTHTAIVTVTKDAASGTVPIQAVIDGQIVVTELSLTGTRESVAFISRPRSILIPSDSSVSAQCNAVVRSGNGDELTDSTVKYEIVSPADGINIDETTGKITVDSSAKPSTITVLAKALSSSGEEITRSADIIIYSLNFVFGSGSAADNQTIVTADTVYNDALGFGIEGSARNADGYIYGSDLVFKANTEPGRVYKITVNYEGTLYLEKFDGYLTGIKKDTNTEIKTNTYEVAVVGDGKTVGKGVLDLNLSGEGKLASLQIEQLDDKTAGSKPIWIEIGDSTVAQNPSWGYVLASNDNWSLYPELLDSIEGFKNMGRGARQLTSFYNEGLLDSVLRTVRPGDVVSISGMGTNGYDGTINDFKDQLNYYIDSIAEMGGKVILGSYTPNGNWGAYKDKVYDPQTETFRGKRYDDYDVALYEVYISRAEDENILGYIDIGSIADRLMTSEVKKARDEAGSTGDAADAAAAARADEILKWYPNDFNHYTSELSYLILPEITKSAAALIQAAR